MMIRDSIDRLVPRLWRGQYQAKRVAARRAGSSYAYDLPGGAAEHFRWEIHVVSIGKTYPDAPCMEYLPI